MDVRQDDVPAMIRAALAALGASQLTVRDDSQLHAGHPGARGGGGHYHLDIESPCFAGQSLVLRHRQIYAALADLMGSHIHALAIEARAPGEDASAREPRQQPTSLFP